MQTETLLPPVVPAAAKEIPYADAPAFFESLRAKGVRIVQCHGTFDLVHPGHIIHFEEARALGDVLVVTLTGSRHVNKGPGRPYFDDRMRVKALATLSIVDYVVVVPFAAAVEAIECVKPDVYCKGKEYEDQSNDVTGNIRDDVDTVARIGGEVRYVGSVVFSFVQTFAQARFAYSWQLLLGSVLLIIILFAPGGLWSLFERLTHRWPGPSLEAPEGKRSWALSWRR